MTDLSPRLRLEQLLATPEPFRAWLTESRAWRIGFRGDCGACPVAEYLYTQGYQQVQVTSQFAHAWTYVGELCLQLPPWCDAFIRAVDHSGPRGSGILRATALRLLSETTSVTDTPATPASVA
jgi:hypothetical protein